MTDEKLPVGEEMEIPTEAEIAEVAAEEVEGEGEEVAAEEAAV